MSASATCSSILLKLVRSFPIPNATPAAADSDGASATDAADIVPTAAAGSDGVIDAAAAAAAGQEPATVSAPDDVPGSPLQLNSPVRGGGGNFSAFEEGSSTTSTEPANETPTKRFYDDVRSSGDLVTGVCNHPVLLGFTMLLGRHCHTCDVISVVA
jgi:hypothetical protein